MLRVSELRRAGAMSTLGEESYASAFRRCGRQAERARQVALVREVGETLDALTRKPLVWTAVRLMRGPARLAGLGELHEFLEKGFRAFRPWDARESHVITARESGFSIALCRAPTRSKAARGTAIRSSDERHPLAKARWSSEYVVSASGQHTPLVSSLFHDHLPDDS